MSDRTKKAFDGPVGCGWFVDDGRRTFEIVPTRAGDRSEDGNAERRSVGTRANTFFARTAGSLIIYIIACIQRYYGST